MGTKFPKNTKEIQNSLLRIIVSRMEMKLIEPEAIIITFLQEGEAMYMIAQGECEVNIPGDKDIKSLQVGHYFGEISLIYGC